MVATLWTVRQHQPGRPGRYLNMAGADHSLAGSPGATASGKEWFRHSFSGTKPISAVPHNLAITEAASFVNASGKQIFAPQQQKAAAAAAAAVGAGRSSQQPAPPDAAGLPDEADGTVFGGSIRNPIACRWIMIDPLLLRGLQTNKNSSAPGTLVAWACRACPRLPVLYTGS